mmetsp:Transcript_10802/g.17548  ORF Transcript_10802/g.17548 Transcript_10802/m.17548 type:complete len:337 (-) Transcript_10802:194-1204(-)
MINRLIRRQAKTRRAASCTPHRLFSAKAVRVHEVAPRDGLQNEKAALSLEDKIELCRLLASSSPSSIELTSFVRPDRVPNLKDAKELCAALADQEWYHTARSRGMPFAALVPNMRGLDNLLTARESSSGNDGCPDTCVLITSCTDSHSKANVGRPIKEALEATMKVLEVARKEGLGVRAYCSMAFGCPFEGEVDPAVVVDISRAYAEGGAHVLGIADTLGCATPAQTRLLVNDIMDALKAVENAPKISLHMHDTNGRARDNCIEGMKIGVREFDAAVGGCGGCNFAPGAKGNLSTQGLLYAIDQAGCEHSVLEDELAVAHGFLEDKLQRPLDQSYE